MWKPENTDESLLTIVSLREFIGSLKEIPVRFIPQLISMNNLNGWFGVPIFSAISLAVGMLSVIAAKEVFGKFSTSVLSLLMFGPTGWCANKISVSYTHLTLPTICSV